MREQVPNDANVEDQHDAKRKKIVNDQIDVIPHGIDRVVQRVGRHKRAVRPRVTGEDRQMKIDQGDTDDGGDDQCECIAMPVHPSILSNSAQVEETIRAQPDPKPSSTLKETVVEIQRYLAGGDRQSIQFEAELKAKEMIQVPAVDHQNIGEGDRTHEVRRRTLTKLLLVENDQHQTVEDRIAQRETEMVVSQDADGEIVESHGPTFTGAK